MSTTAVLRFRDFESDTVGSHRELIQQTGAVWWAWWKKDSEEFQHENLELLSGLTPIGIGLIDRQNDKRFVASCTRVVFSRDGANLSSPEPARTPPYYRDDSFPAWLMLTAIEQVDAREWNTRFGDVPLGEPTLFVLPGKLRSAARTSLFTKYEVQPVNIRSTTILHLSDLHFGGDYGFPLNNASTPTTKETLDVAICDGLEFMECPEVGLVVISGDITTAGDLAGFLQAQEFIGNLLARLKLTNEQLVIVPGNHDILLDDQQTTRNFSGEQPFRNFLQVVLERKVELNRLSWYTNDRGSKDLLVLSLNSVRPRTSSTMEYGYVGSDLYGPLLKTAQLLRSDIAQQEGMPPLLIAVLHHHVLPTTLIEEPAEGKPVSLVLDAGQLIQDLQLAGVDAALHGHQHIPFVGSTARSLRAQSGHWSLAQGVHVIGAGSSGAGVNRLWPHMRNNCVGVYTINGDEDLDVRMLEYAPGVPFREYLNLRLPIAQA